MYSKLFIFGLQFAALTAAARHDAIVPRQTDAPNPADKKDGGSAECSSMISSLYDTFPKGSKIFANRTASYYKTATKTVDGIDCEYTSALPSLMVHPVADFLKDVEHWTEKDETKKLFGKIKEAKCPAVKDLDEPKTCANETKQWLHDVAELNDGTIEDLLSAATGLGASGALLAVAYGVVAALAYVA